MTVAEKEMEIIKLNDERRELIKKGKEPHTMLEHEIMVKRIVEINRKIEELTKSEQSYCN